MTALRGALNFFQKTGYRRLRWKYALRYHFGIPTWQLYPPPLPSPFANDMLPSRQQLAFGDREIHERRGKDAILVSEFDAEFHGETFRTE